MYVYMYTYIYTYMCVYMYTYIYTYMYTRVCAGSLSPCWKRRTTEICGLFCASPWRLIAFVLVQNTQFYSQHRAQPYSTLSGVEQPV